MTSRTNSSRRVGRIAVVVAIIASLVMTATGTAAADPLPANSCDPLGGYIINFLNGIQNTWQQAGDSRQDLETAYGDVHGTESIEYHLLYNDTHNIASDVMEVFQQKVREAVEAGILTDDQISDIVNKVVGTGIRIVNTPARALSWLLSKVPIDVIRDAAKDYGAFLDALPGWYESAANGVHDWMADQVREFSDVALLDPETRQIIDNHVATVRGQIASGKKSLIVAHSQGNLFANSIAQKVRDVISHNSLGVVHVATPALLTSGPYVTADTDLIILPFIQAHTAPPANAHLEPFVANYTNHGFGIAYLRLGAETRTKVLASIDSTLDGLERDTAAGSDGLFTVTLTWAGPGDVDLHVIEPNGNEVYYGARTGSVGFLDVDNVTADGPEHYYAACDSGGLTGDFLVGVTNYSAPTSVPIQVQLSSATRVYSPVSIDIGSSTFSSAMSFQLFRVQARPGPSGGVDVTQLPA